MENEAQKKTLCGQLATTDTSLGFLVLILVSLLLSLRTVGIQRQQLCLTIEGDTEGAAAAPPVFPLKIGSSALVVGALGFFLTQSVKTYCATRAGEDCVAKRSATMNLWAALLVLSAALIRLFDLNFVHRCQAALPETDDLPV